jgi:acyl transferase domain-containing protein
MDPMQRGLLETTYKAFENGEIRPNTNESTKSNFNVIY